MTDLLGICTAWGDNACVVQPAAGPPVTIPLSDVVSGKPVPPRPSVRLRATPREAQVRGFALFPDLETRPVGDWVLRRSPTATARRANSVLAFGPSGVDDDVEQVLDFYERPVAAVLAGSPEADRLTGLGWVPESGDADTIFHVSGVARARRTLGEQRDTQIEVRDGMGVVRIDEIAGGYSGCDGEWVGVRGIEVHPDHRRQGLALTIMAALLEWGAEQGATTAYLQVLADNEPALGLYERLGFVEHHRYRYLTPERE